MEYRQLGRSGIKVSVLSFGSWVTFDNQVAVDAAVECMQAARDAGCNFFDNAEAYAAGGSEKVMAEALRRLGWPRWSYVLTTKLYWGLYDDVNMHNTLNRKYLMQAIDGSLERFGLDFVDVVYCHRHDPDTTIEETLSQYVFDGALVWHITGARFAGDSGVPFLYGGGGYLRELHEENAFVEEGIEYHAGGGIKWWFGQSGRIGMRAEGGISIRDGGFDFKDGKRMVPVAGASVIYSF